MSQRSFRHRVGRFLVEGPQAVREALTHRQDVIEEVFVAADATGAASDLARAARTAGTPVVEVPESVLLAFTETVHPQGIAAVCRFLDVPIAAPLAGAQLLAVLVDVRDPGNAGTILRTADAAGAHAVVFAGDSVDPYNGKCVRSTAGSLFHLPIVVAPDTAEVVPACRAAGLTLAAATAVGAEQLPAALARGALSGPVAWVFGNEAHGLAADVVSWCDLSVAIPIRGRAESLNLAAAAAICLYAGIVAGH